MGKKGTVRPRTAIVRVPSMEGYDMGEDFWVFRVGGESDVRKLSPQYIEQIERDIDKVVEIFEDVFFATKPKKIVVLPPWIEVCRLEEEIEK